MEINRKYLLINNYLFKQFLSYSDSEIDSDSDEEFEILIENNQIQSIHQDTFKGLTNLKFIQLKNNPIKSKFHLCFQNL